MVDILYSIEYNKVTFKVVPLPEFSEWLDGIKDRVTQRRLAIWATFDPWAKAHSKCVSSLAQAGACITYMHDNVLIVMLGGGDKSTQQADIAAAISLSKTL